MISSIEWVPQGAADPTPKKYEMSPAELELLEKQAELEAALGDDIEEEGGEDESDDENQTAKNSSKITLPPVDPKSLPADLRMDEYSDDDDDNDAVKGSHIGNLLVGKETDAEMLLEAEEEAHRDEDGEKNNPKYDDDSDEDSDDDLADVPDTREYMPVDVEGLEAMGLSHAAGVLNDLDDNEDDDNASDLDDINLNPDDAMICVAKTEEDFASLEVHVYEQKSGNLFVHHDIPLPSFPLCLAHGDVNADGGVGNYCAVGTFSPGIEIWNLDILNPLEPMCVLGGEDTSAADELMKLNMMRAASGKKLKKNKHSGKFGTPGGLKPGSHTDAVMALAWNKVHRQVIASGSADCSVKLWDITQANSTADDSKCCASTFTHHNDKVQSLAWHPTEGTLLATGGFDRTVALVDARSSDSVKKVKLPADCEALSWDPYNSQCLTAASEDGTLQCWDVRKFDTRTPLWSFVANEYGGVSDLSYNPSVPGMMVTCATDKTVTLWDTQNSVSGTNVIPPHPCGNKDMGVGKLYTVSFYPSSPWLLGCGGAGNELSLWDLREESAVQNRFKDRLSEATKQQQQQQQEEEAVNGNINNNNSNKEQNFEAMMAAGDAAAEKARTKASKKKKKGKKKKEKVHRR